MSSLGAFTAEIVLVNFDFTQKGGFLLSKFDDSFSNEEQISIGVIAIYIGQIRYFFWI